MTIIIKTLLSIVVLLSAVNVFAVQQVDIYKQSILVEKNANTARINLVRQQAMLQALQSATLKNDIDKYSVIKAGLKKHKQYILSEKVESSDEVFVSVIGQKIPMIKLVIQFDSKKVGQLLLKANISTLDEKRPETLAVIMVQNKDGSTKILARKDLYIEQTDVQINSSIDAQTQSDLDLLANNIEGELNVETSSSGAQSPFYESIAQQLKQDSDALKLPIVWPMMDHQDLFFFNQDDFWQVDKESIIGFAKRYSIQVILIARIKEHDDGRFIGEWNVLDLGRPKVQYYNSIELFTDAGLKQLSQTIMQQYGINPNDKKDEKVLIRMKQASNIAQFHQNEVYLKNISGVNSVSAITVDGMEVTYSVQLNVGQKQFISSLKLTDGIDYLIEDELRRPITIDLVVNDFE